MRTLRLTDRQAELLERSLFGLVGSLEHDTDPYDPIDLKSVDGVPKTRGERNMLTRIWWNMAKLLGRAE